MGAGDVVLTICCCLWGEWPAPGWGERYVERLRRGVERNLTVPHRFVVFADRPERMPAGYEVRKLRAPSWQGCLPKLYVHSPESGLEGRVLLLDLDNVVTGSLDDMASYSGPLAVRAWFHGWDRGEVVADGDMIGFEAGSYESRELWRQFAADPRGIEQETGGRERFFLRHRLKPDFWQAIVPGQVVSYKNHCRNGLPKDARIVSFHGQPRPHDVRDRWVREAWS